MKKITVMQCQDGEPIQVKVVFPVPRRGLHFERCSVAEHLVKVVTALEQHGAAHDDSPWYHTRQVSTNVKEQAIEVVTYLPVGKTAEQMVEEVQAAVGAPRSGG